MKLSLTQRKPRQDRCDDDNRKNGHISFPVAKAQCCSAKRFDVNNKDSENCNSLRHFCPKCDQIRKAQCSSAKRFDVNIRDSENSNSFRHLSDDQIRTESFSKRIKKGSKKGIKKSEKIRPKFFLMQIFLTPMDRYWNQKRRLSNKTSS